VEVTDSVLNAFLITAVLAAEYERATEAPAACVSTKEIVEFSELFI
jgi:hypothetical protein